MARAGRYGNCPPDAFARLDWDEALDFADRVEEMHAEQVKLELEAQFENTKIMLKAWGAR